MVIAVIGTLMEGSTMPYDLSAAIENMCQRTRWAWAPARAGRLDARREEVQGDPRHPHRPWPVQGDRLRLDRLAGRAAQAPEAEEAARGARVLGKVRQQGAPAPWITATATTTISSSAWSSSSTTSSDCASWKTELVGTDFIQTQDIQGSNEQEIIEACIEKLKAAGLAEDIAWKIGGKGILLTLTVAGCPHMLKEQLLRENGIKPYSCLAANMILDQLIEKLGYASTYLADLKVDERDPRGDLRHTGEDRRGVGLVQGVAALQRAPSLPRHSRLRLPS